MSDAYWMHVDESTKGKIIAVGGFICGADDLASIAASWTAMREQMGIDEEEPLKWSFSQASPVRIRIEKEGWNVIERRRLMIDTMRTLPITLVADVVYDERNSRRPPLDFYKDALDWLILWFRNFVTDNDPKPPGPHVVVLDQPSPAPAARPTEDPPFSWLKDRETIWYRVYQRRYNDGWYFPRAYNPRVRALRKDGFYPSVVIAHAKFNPFLEIADAVAGAAADFAHYNIQNYADGKLPEVSWQDEQMMRLAQRFRAKPSGDILRYGLGIFPNSTPGYAEVCKWVTTLCTDDQFASFRED